MMDIQPNFFSLAAMMNSCRRSAGNGVAGDSNTRPTKKIKVESPPSPIPAVPFSYVLPPIIPTRFRVSPPSVAPKRNPVAIGTASNSNGAQKSPTGGKIAPPSPSPDCNTCRQFWKAGDYEGAPTSGGNWQSYAGGSDHIRVHPRFLHSNSTSHRWVLGALAELLDNSLDEVRNGATFVNIDVINNKKSGDRMLLIEDNGGGMDPIKLRQCMSLGYSAKSKMANAIGQYGNGFKTSSMRLGADAIVFSRFRGENGSRSTQSIGLLSYTFLRCTRKEDIEVPMLDYGIKGEVWERIVRTSDADWNNKVDTIVQWSPFSSEANLLEQFNDIKDHGTRIFIYNLWEDDQGKLELDFDADPYDIQIRGVNRDEKNIQMAQQYPNSRHFLTYRHSLRSYASILYLSVPREFRMILRGKDIEHHNIVNDMMMSQKVTYRPQNSPEGDYRMTADVTVGFVKDAGAHIDVQGFNVYHKNRLIKPFWRVWHPPGSDGRGVIGVLEANFVEPAHDKQGFERTLVLSRLEAKLVQMQKNYWSSRCHEIGYAPRRMKKSNNVGVQPPKAPSSEMFTELNILNPVSGNNIALPSKSLDKSKNGQIGKSSMESNMKKPNNENKGLLNIKKDSGNVHSRTSLLSHEGSSETIHPFPVRMFGSTAAIRRNLSSRSNEIGQGSSLPSEMVTEENRVLRESLKMKELELLGDLRRDLEEERNKCKFLETELDQEKNRCKSLETQLQEATRQIQELNKEQDNLIDIFSDQRKLYEIEEEKLRNDLKDALSWIKLFRNKDRQEN